MPPKRVQDQEQSHLAKPTKRPKASRACATCRKTKSRCELLDTAPSSSGRLQCHRCKVLDIDCSFQNSEIIILSNGIDSNTVVSGTNVGPSASVTPRSPSPQRIPTTQQFGVPKAGSIPGPSSASIDGEEEAEAEADGKYLFLAPWRLLSIADDVGWTKSPILALQGLIESTPCTNGLSEPSKETYTDATLTSILTTTQINYLIDIFEARYRPWMNLPQTKTNDVALDMVRCAVASRHLDSITRPQVSRRLQSLVERTLLQPGYHATMSLEFIESLLILALWTPICGSGYAIARDNRLLATSAMEIAIGMGLSHYDNLQLLSQRHTSAPQPDPEDIRKTRLWCAVRNIERMLLLGTGRCSQIPSSMGSDLTRAFSASDPRDTGLVLCRRMFDIVDAGTTITWEHSAESQRRNFDEVGELFPAFAWLYRSIFPLAIVSPHIALYFNMVHSMFHICKMAVLHSLLCGFRGISDPNIHHTQWVKTTFNGIPVVARLGGEYVASMEAALVPFLSCQGVSSLSTAPDNYFILMAYAAISIIITKASVHQLRVPPLSGNSDELVTMTIDRLQQVALSPDHIPAKCATIVREANATWERKKNEPLGTLKMPAGSPWSTGSGFVEASQGSGGENGDDLGCSSIHPPGVAPNYDGFEDGTMDPGNLFDPQFWSNFLDNLKS